MKAPEQIQDMIGEIAHLQSCDHLDFQPLPSGVCFVRVTAGQRHFVMEYHPKEGTGVSENLADTPAFVGHDEVFPSLSVAIKRFSELLASAVTGEENSSPFAAMALHDRKI